MSFVKVSSEKEIAAGKMIGVKTAGKEILIANLDGKYHAADNICPHMGCKLSGGIIKDGNVICPCHKSVFELKTGNLIDGPAKKSLAVYKTRIENGQIMVDV
jgi:3-phenylpropionate/trans-cinnamate dioxygenase ferredoxin subunit